MTQLEKLLAKLLSGNSDANIPFIPLCQLLDRLGFEQRINGSHHIFTKEAVEEILNLQPSKKDKAKAKPYQVRQIRTVILKYNLGNQDDAL
ncbi:MAG TPA: toxin HicA [Cyanobacteria bacterium UBA11149]|nr:toxin HicA [Cyanobacteria bacterium UBA11367]HBE57446.1 toxin HicA [Cyanobacteria bacterium UBA11366]HBK66076.1 toxin HicA [Cyanobacteria bacterium UBA11166]HBR76787.1 toxin HicA [Cyanobacteria bacterium UBA11159]HBS71522.1 toxin HicA [Cyanobacteria bacterium UBA11153]HBW89444.1 toxin HicA [Cyanobacteria bacterium UBA11149]HCA97373.1 toxin HicA [Cyanobacteria bacterium UBA9226]